MTSMSWPLACRAKAWAALPGVAPGVRTAGLRSPMTRTLVRLVTSFSGIAPTMATSLHACCRVALVGHERQAVGRQTERLAGQEHRAQKICRRQWDAVG